MTVPEVGVVDECPAVDGKPAPLARALGGGGGAKWFLAAGVAAAAAMVDLLVKRLVHTADFSSVELLPFLTIERQGNRGVAFGLLWERQGLILPATALALVVILVYLHMENRPVFGGISAGLLLGGSLGNLYERVVRGEVTDFINVPYWPTFNLADVFIFCGVALVAVGLVWGQSTEGSHD